MLSCLVLVIMLTLPGHQQFLGEGSLLFTVLVSIVMELELRLATGEEEKRLLQEKLAESQVKGGFGVGSGWYICAFPETTRNVEIRY